MTYFLSVLGLAALITSINPADAQEAASATPPAGAGTKFASVWRIRGDISATAGDTGTPRKLREGDAVFVGERVRAETSAEAVFKTEDAGLLAVRPGGIFVAERFAAEGKNTDTLSLRIVSGALRLITGWIGRGNPAQYRILTPSATIGIRGTDHEPYVMTADLASALSEPAGTYDKVNRGGTTLATTTNTLDIEPGKVGFVRRAGTTRALMTLLLPVLLERIPDFYVPGAFDAELDQLSPASDDNALRQLELRRSAPSTSASPPGSAPAQPGLAPATAPVATVPAATAPVPPADPATVPSSGAAAPSPGVAATPLRPGDAAASAACGAGAIAQNWLAQLDAAMARRNGAAVVRLFAPEASVRATVRDKDGAETTLEIGRDEFVQSSLTALRNLSQYRQRRSSTQGAPEQAGSCDRIVVRSAVIEQGRQNGKPYRFESVEDYVLEKIAGKWVAVRAMTRQQ